MLGLVSGLSAQNNGFQQGRVCVALNNLLVVEESLKLLHIYGILDKTSDKSKISQIFISLKALGINEHSTVITMIVF